MQPAGSSPAEPVESAADRLFFEELSKQLAAQRDARESLRTRSIAILSAGALVFTFARSASTDRLDAWLLISLIALVVMGFCVALVVLPAPITTLQRHLTLGAIGVGVTPTSPQETLPELYRDLNRRLSAAISSNEAWNNSRSFLYLVATVLLVVEIGLIAIHFSTSVGYRIAVGTVIGVFLIAMAWQVRSVTQVVFPEGLWTFAVRIPLVGPALARRLFADSVLSGPLASVRVPAPSPGEDIEDIKGADLVEDAIAHAGDVTTALRQSDVYVLGFPAGEVSGAAGTESDLLHFEADTANGEETFLPVFTHPHFMVEPLRRNEEWRTLSVLQVPGRELLDNIDDDVIVVINPWSESEAQIAPDERGAAAGKQGRSGNAKQQAGGTTRSAILDALRGGSAMTASEVAAVTGLPRGTVSGALSKLARRGEVIKAKRGYRLPD
jgi:DNA-binding transcriptional ArsR family regulator